VEKILSIIGHQLHLNCTSAKETAKEINLDCWFGFVVFRILFFKLCEESSQRKHTATKGSASLASLAQRIESAFVLLSESQRGGKDAAGS
jgi:hypothetical protein